MAHRDVVVSAAKTENVATLAFSLASRANLDTHGARWRCSPQLHARGKHGYTDFVPAATYAATASSSAPATLVPPDSPAPVIKYVGTDTGRHHCDWLCPSISLIRNRSLPRRRHRALINFIPWSRPCLNGLRSRLGLFLLLRSSTIQSRYTTLSGSMSRLA